MARRSRSLEIQNALLAEVDAHPKNLIQTVMGEFGISRPTVLKHAQELVEQGFLVKDGTTRPRYTRGPSRRDVFTYVLRGLAEDRVWTKDVAPLLRGLPGNVMDIAHHGLTEMVNNAVDHSEGSEVQVFIDVAGAKLSMWVQDDGIGIFRKITRALDLPDERLALLELSKGKLTTDPTRHSGEGIFFTSRMFDSFQIFSGELVFDHIAEDDDYLLERDGEHPGTSVSMQIATDSTRTSAEVFKEFSSGPDDFSFAKTVVPVRLARVGNENLVSRSQAKRLMQRVDRFKTVILDFDDVERVGQAFADEIFRVFANAHPELELVALHVSTEVQQMIRRAEVLRDEQASRL